jgi:hypothetical protein
LTLVNKFCCISSSQYNCSKFKHVQVVLKLVVLI